MIRSRDLVGKTEKEIEYEKYIEEHILNVKKVWEAVDAFLKDSFWLDDFNWWSIDALIKDHDKSKYSDNEFYGYRQFFFPEEGKEKNKKSFDYSWNHHQKENPHHWQYWIMWKPEGSVCLDMPFVYLFEMLCDWSAMSLKFGDYPSAFYEKEKSKMFLSESTRMTVERWLPIFDKTVESCLI